MSEIATGLESRVIQATHRVPARTGAPAGEAAAVARQLDAALLSVGFTGSRELLEHVSGLTHGAAVDTAAAVLAAVRELVGDHVAHNVYFADFPANVPDTVEFWTECLVTALVGADPAAARAAGEHLVAGTLNLLELPTYGRYQHTYADLLAHHDDLVASGKDRVTVLHLGADLAEEAHRLYLRLAASTIPLAESDRDLLATLAAYCVDADQPEEIGVRENRALINRVRLAHDRPLLVDTVTDVLRLACALSGGDVTLRAPTRFTSLPRADRRALMAALDRVVRERPARLGDVNRHAGRWKRLGERLHPHEHPSLPHARDVFAVARGDQRVPSLAGRVEAAFADGDTATAVRLLATAPGQLVRALDRLLRTARADEADLVAGALAEAAPRVAGRVLVGARGHLANRTRPGQVRIFANRGTRAWVAPDERAPLDADLAARAADVLDGEIAARLPDVGRVLIDPDVTTVAVPTSGQGGSGAFGVLPRGSVTRVDGEHLRFFVHWRETRETTDLDLSVLLLDADFSLHGKLSWTELSGYGGVHSGDVVTAPEGATEMVDLDLARVEATYVVPQVNVYDGESFPALAEAFFGYMTRDTDQRGLPFEARTVRTTSDLAGGGRVALPLAFARDVETGEWRAHWMHLCLSGTARFNRVETNRVSTGLLARSVAERAYVTIGDLVTMMRARGATVEPYSGTDTEDAEMFIGLERPEGLGEGVEVVTPDRFAEILTH